MYDQVDKSEKEMIERYLHALREALQIHITITKQRDMYGPRTEGNIEVVKSVLHRRYLHVTTLEIALEGLQSRVTDPSLLASWWYRGVIDDLKARLNQVRDQVGLYRRYLEKKEQCESLSNQVRLQASRLAELQALLSSLRKENAESIEKQKQSFESQLEHAIAEHERKYQLLGEEVKVMKQVMSMGEAQFEGDAQTMSSVLSSSSS